MTFDWQAILLLFKTQPALTAALAAFVVTGALQLAKKAGKGKPVKLVVASCG